MLVGVSFLGVVQAKHGLYELSLLTQTVSPEEIIWKQLIFIFLGFISTIALVCFVVSVDALDCMFNEFRSQHIDNKFRRYFYKSTIHPRYVGFVCLLTSIVFLNASSSVLLGTLTIGVIISVGYRHWFPRAQLTEDSWKERSGVTGFWIRFLTLIAIPIVVQFVQV
jgi:protein-S-isoprenylcysteine O-methyltransferase Ste14